MDVRQSGALSLVSGPSLREQARKVIRGLIITGQMQADQLYSVPRLATELGVSATPVREALLDLAREGLLEPVRNRGFRVVALSPTELKDIYAIRTMLEVPSIAEIARAGLRPAQLEQCATCGGHEARRRCRQSDRVSRSRPQVSCRADRHARQQAPRRPGGVPARSGPAAWLQERPKRRIHRPLGQRTFPAARLPVEARRARRRRADAATSAKVAARLERRPRRGTGLKRRAMEAAIINNQFNCQTAPASPSRLRASRYGAAGRATPGTARASRTDARHRPG